MLIAFYFVSGLTLFACGILLLNTSLNKMANVPTAKALRRYTSSPLQGLFWGTVVTAVLQSSSAVSVVTVGLVHSGILELSQALGIVLGANIGTTITAQILAFPVENLALPLGVLGCCLILFYRWRTAGKLILGLALIFGGMKTISTSFLSPEAFSLIQDILRTASHPLTAIIYGMVVTGIIQSSSVFSGLIMVLAKNGQISLLTATGLILGSNVGTCVTALLASLSANTTAKRVAWAHVFINLFGVILFYPFISPFAQAMVAISSTLTHQIANTHTFFNVISSLLMLPFLRPFTKFLTLIIPEKQK
jgi:phosphate:Na+ symporter